jgi:hypothetical protein
MFMSHLHVLLQRVNVRQLVLFDEVGVNVSTMNIGSYGYRAVVVAVPSRSPKLELSVAQPAARFAWTSIAASASDAWGAGGEPAPKY